LLTITRGFINISSRIHRQAKHFDLTFFTKTFLWMVKPGVTVIYTAHNLITGGYLENKDPPRPPKTPKVPHFLQLFFFRGGEGYPSPQYPLEKTGGERGGHSCIFVWLTRSVKPHYGMI